MKNRLVVAFIIGLFLAGTAGPLLAQENPSASPHAEAAALIAQKEYDQAIRLLNGPAANDPYQFEPNWLLATALLEKCEQMKDVGDPGYRHLVKRPYEIGLRLYKAQPSRPEPYYLIARSLTINDRPRKAGNWILKAVHFSSPQHTHYADFQMVLGDSWTGQMVLGDPRGYTRANAAYHMARDLRKNDPDFVERIERRLDYLSQKRK
jgi:hypothetical protein